MQENLKEKIIGLLTPYEISHHVTFTDVYFIINCGSPISVEYGTVTHVNDFEAHLEIKIQIDNFYLIINFLKNVNYVSTHIFKLNK